MEAAIQTGIINSARQKRPSATPAPSPGQHHRPGIFLPQSKSLGWPSASRWASCSAALARLFARRRDARRARHRHSPGHSRAAGSGLMYSPPHTLQCRFALGAFAVGSPIFFCARAFMGVGPQAA